ncbi:class IV adenylate cyclase [Vreelandella alkaliphila]|uniref:Adenylate cyclase n=1 Tax=Halomonas campaniensis TaxID=213554 RepID=A0A3D0KH07_9GAMM|nr:MULTISPECIES: class IV adenylate cyclase [unclassified Halomonas]HBS82212.1 adenylate cyclase [Halomonas campaniensis]HCA02823.1 adenylate cyclase [Halomonas campaniensis]
MARNIEIKARIDNIEALESRVAKIADNGPTEILQDDTFFQCEAGRLKLRVFSEKHGELIFYRRANQAGPKESFYVRSQTDEPEALRETLALAYGEAGRVRKHRTLYLVDRTRVHLDRVEGLGHFLELEVVVSSSESSQSSAEVAHRLLDRLGIELSQLIEGAYVDLLKEKGS